MENEKLFIGKVRQNRKILIDNVKNQSKEHLNEIWRQIAKDCKLGSAEEAEDKWKQMVNDYSKFLRSQKRFPHANAMSFLQQHLISFQDSSSDDITPAELEQLRLLLDPDSGKTEEMKIPVEKQSDNRDVIKINDSTVCIKAKPSETTLPVVQLVPAPKIIKSVVKEKEQTVNVVTPTKKEDGFIIKRSPAKFGAQAGPIRVVLLSKSPLSSIHPKITHVTRDAAVLQQQKKPLVSPEKRQQRTTQSCHQAAVAHVAAAAPLQLEHHQQQPMEVVLSSDRELTDNSKPGNTQSACAAAPMELEQPQPPVIVVPSSCWETPDNSQPRNTQSCKEAEVIQQPVAVKPSCSQLAQGKSPPKATQPARAAAQLQLQQQQTVSLHNPAPISVSPNEQSGGGNQYTNLTSLELIFLGFAKTLQKMPPALRMKTKRKISEIIDAAELQLFE